MGREQTQLLRERVPLDERLRYFLKDRTRPGKRIGEGVRITGRISLLDTNEGLSRRAEEDEGTETYPYFLKGKNDVTSSLQKKGTARKEEPSIQLRF